MVDITIDASVSSPMWATPALRALVWKNALTAYHFYIDSVDDFVYKKSTDGGATWGSKVTVDANTCRRYDIWHDKATPGDTGTLIHITVSESTNNRNSYYNLDTSDDSLSSQVTVFSGTVATSTGWNLGNCTISKARGGNLGINTWNDLNNDAFLISTDGGANWTVKTSIEASTVDGALLFPGNEADNQDMWAMFWDRSANEISVKVFDDTGNSWAENSVSTNMVEQVQRQQWSGSIRHSDGHLMIAAWSEPDETTADLRVWDYNAGTATSKADVITNEAENMNCSMLINQQNGDIYIAYLQGSAQGSSVGAYYKLSTNGGTSWGSEVALSEDTDDDLRQIWAGVSVGDDGGKFQPSWFNDDLNDILTNTNNAVSIAAAGGDPSGSLLDGKLIRGGLLRGGVLVR